MKARLAALLVRLAVCLGSDVHSSRRKAEEEAQGWKEAALRRDKAVKVAEEEGAYWREAYYQHRPDPVRIVLGVTAPRLAFIDTMGRERLLQMDQRFGLNLIVDPDAPPGIVSYLVRQGAQKIGRAVQEYVAEARPG